MAISARRTALACERKSLFCLSDCRASSTAALSLEGIDRTKALVEHPAAIGLARESAMRDRRIALQHYECLKFGARFSTKAAMPSFWSSVANSEWNSRRSYSMPSASGASYARLMASFAIITAGNE